jgi:hypothetical protein
MQKGERHDIIRELIRSEKIGTQDELSALLEKRGIAATQSSISRDLVELGIVKTGGFYALPEMRSEANIFGLKSVEPAGGNLIVARRRPRFGRLRKDRRGGDRRDRRHDRRRGHDLRRRPRRQSAKARGAQNLGDI